MCQGKISWFSNSIKEHKQGFVFDLSLVFYKAAVQNICNVYYFKTLPMSIFNLVEKQSGIGFRADALFGNLAYLNNLYTVAELHTNFV